MGFSPLKKSNTHQICPDLLGKTIGPIGFDIPRGLNPLKKSAILFNGFKPIEEETHPFQWVMTHWEKSVRHIFWWTRNSFEIYNLRVRASRVTFEPQTHTILIHILYRKPHHQLGVFTDSAH